MGIRSLSIPSNPQPQDVGSPVPGVDAQRTMAEVLGAFKPTPMQPTPATPAPAGSFGAIMQPFQQAATIPDSEPFRKPAQDQSDDDFNSELDQAFGSMKDTLPKEAKEAVKKDEQKDLLKELDQAFGDSPGKNADADPSVDSVPSKIRAFVSTGRNQLEVGNALEKVFGADNVQLRNAGTTNEEYWVNRGKGWQPFDKPGFWGDVPGDLADLSAGTGQVVAGIAGMAAGAAAAYSGVGLAAGPAMLAGGVSGGIVSPLSREAAVRAAGIEDSTYKLKEEIMAEVGINLAFAGLGELSGAGGKWLMEKMSKIRAASKFGAAENRALITQRTRLVIRDLVDDIPFLKTPKGEAGMAFKSAVTGYQEKLGQAVAAVDEKAIAKAADRKFTVDGMLKQMEQTLNDAGVVIDPKTNRIHIPQSTRQIMNSEKTAMKAAAKRGDEYALEEVAANTQSELASEAPSIGYLGDAKGGKVLVDQLIEDYPKLKAMANTQGGIPYKQILDMTRKYEGMAKWEEFAKNPGGAANSYIEKIVGGSINDRMSAVDQLFPKGSAENTANQLAYKSFANNIDRVAALKAVVRSANDPAQIANAVFSKESPDLVRSAKYILGESSKEWKMLRGAKINDMIEKSINAEGIFEGDVFRKQVKDLGPELMSMIGSGEEIGRLNRMAAISSRIDVKDLMRNAGAVKALEEMVSTTSKYSLNPIQMVRNIFKFSRGRVEAINYVRDEVLDQIPKGAGRDFELEFFNEVQKQLDVLTATSKKVSVKRMVKNGAGKLVEEVQQVYVPTSETTRRLLRGANLLTGQAVKAGKPLQPTSDAEVALAGVNAQLEGDPAIPEQVQGDQLAPREE